MRGPVILFGALVASTITAAVSIAQTPGAVSPQIAEGENLFAASCGNQYCHGAAGKGAQGPALTGVPMTPEHIRATILEGRAGTAMVSFREVLEPGQLDAVTAYVVSISSGGKLAMPVSAPAAGRPPAFPPNPPPPQLSTTPIAIGKAQGTPAGGLPAFFEPTTVVACRSCHTFAKRGGPLGIDLALAGKTADEVLASVTGPRVPSRAYPAITVTLANGTRLTGIRGPETATTLSVYDLVMPPVRRTFLKSEVSEIAVRKQGVFDHTRLRYTRQQLLDIAAMIGSMPK